MAFSTDALDRLMSSFLCDISQGKTRGSLNLALATLSLIKRVVGDTDWSNAQELMDTLRARLGPRGLQRASSAAASEALVGNLTRRVLKLVREDYTSATKGDENDEQLDTQESLHKMVVAEDDHEDFRRPIPDLKSKILESVEELLMELETSSEEISNQALEHIHANEVILTIGRSKTVELFLKQAARERKFHVIVAECAPFYHGHEMATSLARAKIQTTVVTDSAIFAVMSRVNKVIIGTNAILANGGLKAVSGSYTVALSAKHFSVPLYVCASMFKLTPQYFTSSDQDAFNKFVSPQETVRGMDGAILSKAHAVTPVFEYVPPELVTLFISNVSGYAPSYVYRLLSELYHTKDYDLTA